MERVRKFGIWGRSELGIGHDVRRAFRTGGIRTWERNRAVKTNRVVELFIVRNSVYCVAFKFLTFQFQLKTRMWANAQRDGRPAEYRWRPLFNAAKFG